MKTNKLFISLITVCLLTGCNTSSTIKEIKTPKFASYKNEVADVTVFQEQFTAAYSGHKLFNPDMALGSLIFNAFEGEGTVEVTKLSSTGDKYKSIENVFAEMSMEYDSQNNVIQQKQTQTTAMGGDYFDFEDGVGNTVYESKDYADMIIQIGTVKEEKSIVAVDNITKAYMQMTALTEGVDETKYMESYIRSQIPSHLVTPLYSYISSYQETEKNNYKWYIDGNVFTSTYYTTSTDTTNTYYDVTEEETKTIQIKITEDEISFKSNFTSVTKKLYKVSVSDKAAGDEVTKTVSEVCDNSLKFKNTTIKPIDLKNYKLLG